MMTMPMVVVVVVVVSSRGRGPRAGGDDLLSWAQLPRGARMHRGQADGDQVIASPYLPRSLTRTKFRSRRHILTGPILPLWDDVFANDLGPRRSASRLKIVRAVLRGGRCADAIYSYALRLGLTLNGSSVGTSGSS